MALLLGGCLGPSVAPQPGTPGGPDTGASGPANPPLRQPEIHRPETLAFAMLNGLSVTPIEGPAALIAAKNETVALLAQVEANPDARLVIIPPAGITGAIAAANVHAYQVLPVPIDVNRAGFVRHTGMPASVESLPRALLPLTIRDNAISFSQLRDPSSPTARMATGGQKLLIWIDIRVPIDAPAGQYVGNVAVHGATPLASLPVDLSVQDFALSDDRHLNMVGQIDWDTLRRYWPEQFEVIRPNLLNRNETTTKAAVATLDQLVSISQQHRVQVHIPRLQPTVKWPQGQPPQIDWTDYDTLVGPWLGGSAFADQTPLGYWALPKIDYLENFPVAARLAYYGAAASHFDQRDWLIRAPVVLEKATPGPAVLTERLLLSAEAGRVLGSHPRVRVMLPLEPDELQIAAGQNLIEPTATGRLHCTAPGLISHPPLRKWPADLERPGNWLRTDLRGLIPYVGAGGDEGDVRTWAWTAFLRNVTHIDFGRCLPTAPDINTPGDPNELIWFYPGSWFGVDAVVPTVQLKWLRAAQQDYEYLYLARERGSVLQALPMARLLVKPVEIQPGAIPDPTYSLLIGTADAAAWPKARELLTKIINLRGPGIETDANQVSAVGLETLHWMEPLEKPVIIPRTTAWSVGTPPTGEIGPWANLRLGIDIYNASDTTPDQNQLQFDHLAPGWEVQPSPVSVPRLAVFQVLRQAMNARIDPNRVRSTAHTPVQLQFRSGFSGQMTPAQFVAPAAVALRRSQPLAINGSLDEWADYDAIQLGPLVKMMTRPAVQRHELERADKPCDIYTGWSDTDFYLAFRAEGLSAKRDVQASRNFVDYQYRRAWSEDVCQVLMQAMYEDGTTGPLVHLSLKPGGNLWAERRLDARTSVELWQNLQTATRYAATLDGDIWRGELAIPWQSLIAEEKTAEFAAQGRPNLPVMLKFNFATHRRDIGESASWAGPIDSSRDDSFTGVLVLKEPEKSATPDAAR